MRIVWTQDARGDLADIYEYVALNSPYYAALVVERILESVRQLTSFPLSGRIVPEVASGEFRELIRGKYRIVYRVRADVVEKLIVFHAARHLTPDDGPERFDPY